MDNYHDLTEFRDFRDIPKVEKDYRSVPWIQFNSFDDLYRYHLNDNKSMKISLYYNCDVGNIHDNITVTTNSSNYSYSTNVSSINTLNSTTDYRYIDAHEIWYTTSTNNITSLSTMDHSYNTQSYFILDTFDNIPKRECEFDDFGYVRDIFLEEDKNDMPDGVKYDIMEIHDPFIDGMIDRSDCGVWCNDVSPLDYLSFDEGIRFPEDLFIVRDDGWTRYHDTSNEVEWADVGFINTIGELPERFVIDDDIVMPSDSFFLHDVEWNRLLVGRV